MVSEQLHYITNREEIFDFSNKKMPYSCVLWRFANAYRKLVKKGDFAINSRSDRRGSCGISSYEGSVSLINTILAPLEKMNPRYYDWLFHTIQFSDEFYKWGHGIVDDLWTTNWRDMKKITIPMPDLDEQERIATFLDVKCSEIDSLAMDIQTEIDTLEEYKNSIITEKVTKGLNPDVEMINSETEWVGRCPIHWQFLKGKYIFSLRNEKGNTKELQLLSPTQKFGVIPQSLFEKLTTNTTVKVKENTDLSQFKTIHKGDFCISLRSFQGGFEYCLYEGVVSPAYQVFYPITKICDSYYKYLFKEQSFISKMNSYTLSLRDGKNIAFADFANTCLPVPPLREQEEIASFLDKVCAEIDSIIETKKKQLTVLDEYKKAIIYEYVTGKKEVI